MSWYPYTTLIAAILNLILAVFVFFKSRKIEANRLFALLLLDISLWCFGYFYVNTAETAKQALLFTRIAHVPIAILPALFIHFVYSLEEKKGKIAIWSFYALSAIMSILIFTPTFVVRTIPNAVIGYQFVPGYFYIAFGIYYFGCLILSLSEFISILKKSFGFYRWQIKFLIILQIITLSAALTYLGVNTNYLSYFPPVDKIVLILFSFVFTYAILTRSFIGIKTRLNNTFIVTAATLIMASAHFSVILFVNYLISGRWDYIVAAVATTIFFSILIALKPSRDSIISFTEQLVYGRGKHSKIVNDVSNALISMLDTKSLINYLINSIVESLQIESISIMLLEGDTYKIKASKNITNRFVTIKEDSELVNWFMRNQRALSNYELDYENPSHVAISKDIKRLKAEIVVPLVYKEKLVGILNIYKKESGKMFSNKDLSTLESIGRSAAIALENARLYEQAITDSLTGLYHHKYFFMKLVEELNQAENYKYPLAVYMLDLDYFKKINDEKGHQIGDEVLIELSKVVNYSVRSSDIVARYGGEEFSIISSGFKRSKGKAYKKDSIAMAERLRKIIEKKEFTKLKLKITISIGIAFYDGKTNLPKMKEFVDTADKQLYKAKKAGRNKVFYTDHKERRLKKAK